MLFLLTFFLLSASKGKKKRPKRPKRFRPRTRILKSYPDTQRKEISSSLQESGEWKRRDSQLIKSRVGMVGHASGPLEDTAIITVSCTSTLFNWSQVAH